MASFGTPNEQLLLQIITDISGYVRGIDQSIAKAQELQSKAESVSAKVTAEFAKITKSVETLGATATRVLGGVGVALTGMAAIGLKSLFDTEAAMNRARIAIEGSGQSWAVNGQRIQQWSLDAQRATGIMQADIIQGFATATLRGNNFAQSQYLVAEAMKVSIATGQQFGDVMRLLEAAQAGNTRALRALGLATAEQIRNHITLNQALDLFNGKIGDISKIETHQMALARLRARYVELTEHIATSVLPLFDRFVTLATNAADGASRLWASLSPGTQQLIVLAAGFLAAQTAASTFNRLLGIELIPSLRSIGVLFGLLPLPLKLAVGTIIGLFIYMVQGTVRAGNEVRDAVDRVGGAHVTMAGQVRQAIASTLDSWANFVSIFRNKHLANLIDALLEVAGAWLLVRGQVASGLALIALGFNDVALHAGEAADGMRKLAEDTRNGNTVFDKMAGSLGENVKSLKDLLDSVQHVTLPTFGAGAGSPLATAERQLKVLEDLFNDGKISIAEFIKAYDRLAASAKLTTDQRTQLEERFRALLQQLARQRLSDVKKEVEDGQMTWQDGWNAIIKITQTAGARLLQRQQEALRFDASQIGIELIKKSVQDSVGWMNRMIEAGVMTDQSLSAAFDRVTARVKLMIAALAQAHLLTSKQAQDILNTLAEQDRSISQKAAATRREVAKQAYDEERSLAETLAADEAEITGNRVAMQIQEENKRYDNLLANFSKAYASEVEYIQRSISGAAEQNAAIKALNDRFRTDEEHADQLHQARIREIETTDRTRRIEQQYRLGLTGIDQYIAALQEQLAAVEQEQGKETDAWFSVFEKIAAARQQQVDRDLALMRIDTKGNLDEFVKRLQAYSDMLDAEAASDQTYAEAAKKIHQDLANAIEQQAQEARKPWDELWQGIESGWNKVFDDIVGGKSQNVFRDLLKGFEQTWSRSMSTMFDAWLKNMLNPIREQAEQGRGFLGALFRGMTGASGRIAATTPIVPTLPGTLGVPIGFREQFSGTERFAMSDASTRLAQTAQTMTQSTTQAAATNSVFQTAVNVLQQAANTLLTAAQNLLNASIGSPGGGLGGLPNAALSFAIPGGGIAPIMPLVPFESLGLATAQHGGIVRSPSGGDAVPILAHAGEAILNPAQQRALIGEIGSAGHTFNISMELHSHSIDPKTAASVLIENHAAIGDAAVLALRRNHVFRRILGL